MTTESPLRTRLRSALLDARRARDKNATSAVRTVLAALENAEAVPVDSAPAAGAIEDAVRGVGQTDAPRRILTEPDEIAILEAEIASLGEAVATYDVVAPDRAAAARTAIKVLAALR